MGLGPPVCQHCDVMAYRTDERGWHCKYCGETKLTKYAGLSVKRWDQLDENEKEVKRFYDFWRKDNDTTID
jgi:hypothetical protein